MKTGHVDDPKLSRLGAEVADYIAVQQAGLKQHIATEAWGPNAHAGASMSEQQAAAHAV